jgi:hypothetical protein
MNKNSVRPRKSRVNINSVPRTRIVGTEFGQIMTLVTQFFLAAGVPHTDIAKTVATALAKKHKGGARTEYVFAGEFPIYDRVVHEWRTNASYVNAAGRPKPIALNGRNSLASILELLHIRKSAKEVVMSLARAGTVRRTASGEYELMRRYALYGGERNKIPYEPAASFLLGAVLAATMGIQSGKRRSGTYWLHAYSDRIPKKNMKHFLAYSRIKGQQLLGEMDDWLTSYEDIPIRTRLAESAPLTGVGFFPFVQLPVVGNQQRKEKTKLSRTN